MPPFSLLSSPSPESPVILPALLLLQQPAPIAEPKSAYWQQQVAYEITARLDEPKGVLSGTERVQACHVIIASGSVPARAPIPGADSPGVLTSDDLLQLREPPKSMVVIGAGAVGLEWGDIYHVLGTKITVLEALDRMLPLADGRASGRQIEGSIKGEGAVDQIAPRLLSLLQ